MSWLVVHPNPPVTMFEPCSIVGKLRHKGSQTEWGGKHHIYKHTQLTEAVPQSLGQFYKAWGGSIKHRPVPQSLGQFHKAWGNSTKHGDFYQAWGSSTKPGVILQSMGTSTKPRVILQRWEQFHKPGVIIQRPRQFHKAWDSSIKSSATLESLRQLHRGKLRQFHNAQFHKVLSRFLTTKP